MKDSEIFLRAAETCALPVETWSDEHYYCACPAISNAGDYGPAANRLRKEFELMFMPQRPGPDGEWFGKYYGQNAANNSHYRVIALGFMAAIAADEGR
jgi:hypothetical protein